jgi:hypothetical protein
MILKWSGCGSLMARVKALLDAIDLTACESLPDRRSGKL